MHFPCNVFFINPFRHWLYSLSCGFMGFIDATESGLCFKCLGLFLFLKQRFPVCMLLRKRSFTGHYSCLWCLQLSPCILNDVFVFFVARINRINPLKSLACSSFGFSSAHSCFSLLWVAFPILVQASGHMWSGRDVVLDFCQSLTGPHTSFWRSFVQQCESRETSPRIRQISVSFDIPMVINSFFLCYIQIGVSWPDDINVFQWNKEWFFLRHVQLNSRFNMMTINEISLNRPKVFSSLSPWDSPLRFSLLTVNSRLRVVSWNS